MAPYLTEEELKSILQKNNLLTGMVLKALRQAKKSHSKIKRDSGKPYLEEHIYPIVKELIDSSSYMIVPEELIVGAILHDAIEDDFLFTQEKCKKEFSEKILKVIKPLTKLPKDNAPFLSQKAKMSINEKYLNRLKKAPKYSQFIKLADRYNNIASYEVIGETPKYRRYTKETRKFFLPFAKERSKYFYNKIKEKLDELEKEKKLRN